MYRHSLQPFQFDYNFGMLDFVSEMYSLIAYTEALKKYREKITANDARKLCMQAQKQYKLVPNRLIRELFIKNQTAP